MRKTLAVAIIFAFVLTLLPQSFAVSESFVGELRLSQEVCAPSGDGRLYIYLPVQSGSVDCTLTIYDAMGRALAVFSASGLKQNTHCFIWDFKPGEGNAAGYPADSFVPDGSYTIEARCESGGQAALRFAEVQLGAALPPVLPEAGIPNYTGDYEADYMVSQILTEIPTGGLSTVEKIRAVYSWVQQNCRRYGEAERTYFDLDLLRDQINAQGRENDSLRREGLINYNVYGNLYTKNAKKMMLSRIGTCLEFVSLFQLLLARLGIESWVVDGDFYNSDGSVLIHKWNYIRIDGQYYWSDVRIDNASYERSERTQLYYDYFLETDTELWAERHSWDREAFPERNTKTPPMSAAAVESLPSAPLEGDIELPRELSAAPESAYTLMQLTDFSVKEAVLNQAPVVIDGREQLFEAYTIDGYNYFKLRDLAYVLEGTTVQFEVCWVAELSSVWLFSGYGYTPVGGELESKSGNVPQATPSSCEIVVDGETVALAAYVIDGNNYFRLRDVGILFDFSVEWLGNAGMIAIRTDRNYSA